MDPEPKPEQEMMPSTMPKQLIKPDLKEGLVNRRNRLQTQLDDLDAAIKALDDNPAVAQVLELVGRASRY